MWQRWRDGGVLFSKTFPDQQTSVLDANDIARRFAEDRIREIVTDPAVAEDLISVDHPIGTSATYPCDVLVFATGFDALTGAMTRIDPKDPDGQRLSDI
jgi:hypothetical protein